MLKITQKNYYLTGKNRLALIVKNIGKELKKQIVLLAQSTMAKEKIKEKISKNFDNNGDQRIIKKIENYINNFNYN